MSGSVHLFPKILSWHIQQQVYGGHHFISRLVFKISGLRLSQVTLLVTLNARIISGKRKPYMAEAAVALKVIHCIISDKIRLVSHLIF
jgi:hypothetical protein